MRIKLSKHNLTNDELVVFNKPKIVYIPLISGGDTNITILVNKGEYVYKGSMIAKRKGDFRIPIHSSVSGTVLDFEERTCFNGEKVKCVVIENDFKEKIEQKTLIKKNINEYTKDEFINILRDNGIIGMGGAGFPTYVKYDNTNAKTLLVNAVECEPYITADYMIASKKCEEILEAVDAILEINHMEEAIIVIKEDNMFIKQLFDNFIGTYLKIKIKCVKNYYPAGWEKNIVKDIIGKDYVNIPLEVGIIVNNISTIFAIYEALKYNKPLIERIVTFSGEALKDCKNVLVKIGTPVIDVLQQLGLQSDYIIVSGGPMMGQQVSNDLVISSNQNCVLALKKENYEVQSCLKCGKCIEACPSMLSPIMIMKEIHSKKTKLEDLKKMKPEKCIECGLCSFICPARISLRNEIKRAKEIIKEGK